MASLYKGEQEDVDDDEEEEQHDEAEGVIVFVLIIVIMMTLIANTLVSYGGTIRQSHLEKYVWYTVIYSDCCAVNPGTTVLVICDTSN